MTKGTAIWLSAIDYCAFSSSVLPDYLLFRSEGFSKADCLIQEMNREVNTIGSKAGDMDVTEYVLQLKNEIEKIREQIQNIE